MKNSKILIRSERDKKRRLKIIEREKRSLMIHEGKTTRRGVAFLFFEVSGYSRSLYRILRRHEHRPQHLKSSHLQSLLLHLKP